MMSRCVINGSYAAFLEEYVFGGSYVKEGAESRYRLIICCEKIPSCSEIADFLLL